MDNNLTVPHLEDKKVELILISRSVGALIKSAEHQSENNLMMGSILNFGIEADPRTNQFVDIFAKHAGSIAAGRKWQAFLEEQAQLPKGSLSTSDLSNSAFWKTRGMITFQKTVRGNELVAYVFNLNDPIDYIKYLVAKSSSLVAKSWNTRDDRNSYRFALRDPEQENQATLDKLDKKRHIRKVLDKYHDSGDTAILYTIFSLFTKVSAGGYFSEIKVTSTSSARVIYAALEDITSSNRVGFIDLLYRVCSKPETELKTYRILNDAVIKGFISRSGNGDATRYYDREGTLVANSDEEVVRWLLSPDNSEIYNVLSATESTTVVPEKKVRK